MYFNYKAIGLSVAVFASPVLCIGSCSQSVVLQASDNGFLQFALLNCVKPTTVATTLNQLGGTILDTPLCFATFNNDVNNPGPNKIDPASNCAGVYTSLIENLKTIGSAKDIFPTAVIGTAGEGCTYDPTTKTIKMSYNCYYRLNVAKGTVAGVDELHALRDFQTSAGYPVMMGTCDASDIRLYSTQDWLSTKIKSMLTTGAKETYYAASDDALGHQVFTGLMSSANFVVPIQFEKDTIANAYKANLSLQEGFCAGCYADLIDGFQYEYRQGSALASTTGLYTACKTDPTSSTCSGSAFVGQQLANFKTCTGYDVSFRGPVCTSSQLSAVASAMTPVPYEMLVNCAVNSASNSQLCGSKIVGQYLNKLKLAAGDECNTCFTEFYAAVQALSTDDVVKTACTSTGLTSAACKTALADPIASYKECSGKDIPFSAVDAQPDAPGGDNTTATPTDSKSSNVLSSIIGMIAVVALSTMM